MEEITATLFTSATTYTNAHDMHTIETTETKKKLNFGFLMIWMLAYKLGFTEMVTM